MIQQCHLDFYLKETESLNPKATGTPVFTAALFTVAKIWKQPNHALKNKENVPYI